MAHRLHAYCLHLPCQVLHLCCIEVWSLDNRSDKQQQLSNRECELNSVVFPAFDKELVSGSLGNLDLQQPPESDNVTLQSGHPAFSLMYLPFGTIFSNMNSKLKFNLICLQNACFSLKYLQQLY